MADLRSLRKGNVVIYNNEPYIVKSLEFVTTGTHCHTKAKFEFEHLLTGKKAVGSMSTHENLQEVEIRNKTGQVLSKSNGKLQIMDSVSYETFEANVSTELYEEIKENDEIIFIEYNGIIKVLSKK